MTAQVKICGITSATALDAAIAGGTDYVGLVLFPPSPRNLTLDVAATFAAQARGRARSVALLVDPDDALIDAVMARVAPDCIQLHGEETAQRTAEIGRRWKLPVIKALKVETAEDAVGALAFRDAADLILFDAKAPSDSTRPGGNGAPFDWAALMGLKGTMRFVLSGGLTPENVARAIRQTGAAVVDVSSGVEASPGQKDPVLIRRFLLAAKAAKQGA
jgi:phosphoribosylanthranilate isomerase